MKQDDYKRLQELEKFVLQIQSAISTYKSMSANIRLNHERGNTKKLLEDIDNIGALMALRGACILGIGRELKKIKK